MYVSKIVGRGRGVYHVAHGANGEHAIRIDGHPAFGGTNRASGPFEHLLAALSSCCQITAKLVADSNGWPLDRFHIEVAAHFDNSVLIRGTPGVSQFDKIDMTVSVNTDIKDSDFELLQREVERRCPIYQLIAASTAVSSNWIRLPV